MTSPLSQYGSTLAKGEWQPIETAPMDGSRVLVWSAEYSAPISAQWYGFGRWKVDYALSPLRYQPTHWMPLPEAPK